MASQESVQLNEHNSSNTFKYILLFIFFFIIGALGGAFGTQKYLASKQVEEEPVETTEDANVKDITKDTESQTLIESLYKIVSTNSIYYSSKGLTLEGMDNTNKLIIAYDSLVENGQGTSEQLTWTWWGSGVCENDFIVDPVTEGNTYSSTCTITRYTASDLVMAYKKIFNSDAIDISTNFSPESGKECKLIENDYLCGSVSNDVVTGELTPKFTIQKVIKDDNVNTITIYDKGYLVDTRSTIPKVEGYDNYYLHSADSITYYYELKSADNLTFKHTFTKASDGNYYYTKTEVAEKE